MYAQPLNELDASKAMQQAAILRNICGTMLDSVLVVFVMEDAAAGVQPLMQVGFAGESLGMAQRDRSLHSEGSAPLFRRLRKSAFLGMGVTTRKVRGPG